MKHKNHQKIIMNIIDDVINASVFNVFFFNLLRCYDSFSKLSSKYIASFTAKPAVT